MKSETDIIPFQAAVADNPARLSFEVSDDLLGALAIASGATSRPLSRYDAADGHRSRLAAGHPAMGRLGSNHPRSCAPLDSTIAQFVNVQAKFRVDARILLHAVAPLH